MDLFKKIQNNFWDLVNKLQAKLKTHVFLFSSLVAVLLLALSLIVLEPDFISKENSNLFLDEEKSLTEAIEISRKDPMSGILELKRQEFSVNKLKNRKNYVLADLYSQIGEDALEFVTRYRLDRKYLEKFSRNKLIKLSKEIGMESIVIKELKKLIEKFPNNPEYKYELAKSFLRQNLFAEAKLFFEEVQKQFPETDYYLGSDYYLSNLDPDLNERKRRLANYLKSSPNGTLASLVADQYISMDLNGTELNNYIALAYYYKDDFQKAIKYFDPTLDSSELYLKPLARTFYKSQRKAEAVKLLLEKLPEIQDETLAIESIEFLLEISDKFESLNYIRQLISKMKIAQDKLLWELANRTHSSEDYRKLFESYPDSFYAPESMSIVFWKEYKRKAYHKALQLAEEHWKRYEHARSHSFVAFWAAKIYSEQDRTDMASSKFLELIEKHPFDYYSFRAEDILRGENRWFKLPPANEYLTFTNWNWPMGFEFKDLEKDYGQDLLELIKAQRYEFILANEENEDWKLKTLFKSWLFAQTSNYLKAISTAYFDIDPLQSPDYKDLKFQFAFPMVYSDLVADEVSKNLKVDPMLVHALIKQESRYQREIVSKVGAIGLMQLMPYTARSLARELNMKSPTVEDLMQPEINIKLGVRYMEQVFRTFDNNMIFAVASYNAGPVAVKHWIKRNDLDMDLFVEEIPYKETRNYVKKVLENYWIYKKLYT